MFVLIEAGSQEVSGQERDLAVPLRTLYPNEMIRQEDFTNRPFLYNPIGPSRFVQNIENYVGLLAKSTLPAFQPVHISAFELQRSVTVGTLLRLVFQEDGITISTAGIALQKASIGGSLQVRNTDTGAVLTGFLQKDGIVRIRPQ
ncbi:MAG: flagellar basal body P-ring formation chaperone FlgA [Beijerinckiaceae bacterium]|nr:flagellar basal body P-ring formation chaperone FlgA [Beijerinckiaceae bacterium]